MSVWRRLSCPAGCPWKRIPDTPSSDGQTVQVTRLCRECGRVEHHYENAMTPELREWADHFEAHLRRVAVGVKERTDEVRR